MLLSRPAGEHSSPVRHDKKLAASALLAQAMCIFMICVVTAGFALLLHKNAAGR